VASSITVFDNLEALALNDISFVDSEVWTLGNMSLISLNRINQVVAEVSVIGGSTTKIAGRGVFDIRLAVIGPPPPHFGLQWSEQMLKAASGVQDDDSEDDSLIDGYWLPENAQETMGVPVATLN